MAETTALIIPWDVVAFCGTLRRLSPLQAWEIYQKAAYRNNADQRRWEAAHSAPVEAGLPVTVARVAQGASRRLLRARITSVITQPNRQEIVLEEVGWAAYGYALHGSIDERSPWNAAAYAALTDNVMYALGRETRSSRDGGL